MGICCNVQCRKKEAGRKYYGCGMKSGFSLDKGGQAMTFFNYDNYSYPPNSPSVPLYISVPLLLEVSPPPCASSVSLPTCCQASQIWSFSGLLINRYWKQLQGLALIL